MTPEEGRGAGPATRCQLSPDLLANTEIMAGRRPVTTSRPCVTRVLVRKSNVIESVVNSSNL